MNTSDIPTDAKQKIDYIFNRLAEMESKADKISGEGKEKWRMEMDNLRKSKETLKTLYENLTNASKDTADQLKRAFNEISEVMDQRMKTIKESFKTELKASK